MEDSEILVLRSSYRAVLDKSNIQISGIQVKDFPSGCFERWILGRSEISGYFNKISGSRRILSALVQTFWSTLILWCVSWVFFRQIAIGPNDAEAAVGAIALVAGIFAGCLLHERSNMYSKWSYLADLFNQIVGTEKLDRRMVHQLSCFAHDVLIMGMWKHESFRAGVVEVIILGLCIRYDNNVEAVHSELKRIMHEGETYHFFKKLVSEIIDKTAPI